MIMPGTEYGLRRAISEIIGGFTISIVVRTFAYGFGLPWLFVLFNLFSIFMTVGLLDKMPFWSTSYFLGWLFGLIYIGPAFLSPLELVLYLGITLLVLYWKVRS